MYKSSAKFDKSYRDKAGSKYYDGIAPNEPLPDDKEPECGITGPDGRVLKCRVVDGFIRSQPDCPKHGLKRRS